MPKRIRYEHVPIDDPHFGNWKTADDATAYGSSVQSYIEEFDSDDDDAFEMLAEHDFDV